jgi:hypothetical protein
MKDVIDIMQEKFGNSSAESRDRIIVAHGGISNIKKAAKLWADHHNIQGSEGDIVIAYATAVDLGGRIRCQEFPLNRGA